MLGIRELPRPTIHTHQQTAVNGKRGGQRRVAGAPLEIATCTYVLLWEQTRCRTMPYNTTTNGSYQR